MHSQPGDSPPVVAIDVGGTKMAMALVDASGTILEELVRPTVPGGDAEGLFAPLADGLAELLDNRWDGQDLEPVVLGIGSAGPVDAAAGTVSPINIPGWRDFPLVARVEETVARITGAAEVRTALIGDGHAIAVGEHWLGAARDVDTMVGLIVSTGVGAGAVLQDRLLTGRTGNTLYLGHTTVEFTGERCVCGNHGCVELYARGPAMVDFARGLGWVGENAEQLTAAARDGDERATAAIERGMRALAAGISAVAVNLDVQVFVVGGGVSHAGEVIFEPLRRHLRDFSNNHFVPALEIREAELDNASLLGAAAAGLSLLGQGPLRGTI